MDAGFTKADSANLPHVDGLMVANFFASNQNFNAAEFRNVKTVVSSRQSYGDDAIGYVQLRHEQKLCTIKSKVCPEHKVRGKSYEVTMIVDENEEKIVSVQCHDCTASQGGCKHAVALLMWVHRRSEEPSSTSIECYWRKSKLSQVGANIKLLTTKDLAKGVQVARKGPLTSSLLLEFVQEAKKRDIHTCQILKHHSDYEVQHMKMLSLHSLIMEYNYNDCGAFLANISHLFTDSKIREVEQETRTQHKSHLWFELRYGRITASNGYAAMKCKKKEGSLVAAIMGGRVPDTQPMKRGRLLEEEVRKVVSSKIGKKIERCGLFISKEFPFIAASPDGLCNETTLIEIKCPSSEKTFKNYIKNGEITEKFKVQIHMQMFASNYKNCYFCVADWNFEVSHEVDIVYVNYDEAFASKIIDEVAAFWKCNIFPLLYESTK